jgi:hypothetical protein
MTSLDITPFFHLRASSQKISKHKEEKVIPYTILTCLTSNAPEQDVDTGGAVVHITSVSGGRLLLNSFISFTMLSLYAVTPFGPHLQNKWLKFNFILWHICSEQEL